MGVGGDWGPEGISECTFESIEGSLSASLTGLKPNVPALSREGAEVRGCSDACLLPPTPGDENCI